MMGLLLDQLGKAGKDIERVRDSWLILAKKRDLA